MENSFTFTDIHTHTRAAGKAVNNFRFSFRQGIKMKSHAVLSMGVKQKRNIKFVTIV